MSPRGKQFDSSRNTFIQIQSCEQFKTPTATGISEFLYLFVLHSGTVYLRPDRSSLNSPHRVVWVIGALLRLFKNLCLVYFIKVTEGHYSNRSKFLDGMPRLCLEPDPH